MCRNKVLTSLIVGIACSLSACSNVYDEGNSYANMSEDKSALVNATEETNGASEQLANSVLEGEAKKKINMFAVQLKSELVTAVKNGGLANGVEICHTRAPEIAAELSTDGWQVRRTSLKARNSLNRADDWELSVLNNFEIQHKNGTNPSELVTTQIEDNTFRLMKAIPTGQLCLACHGSNVDTAVLAAIQKRYPNDMAVGFNSGDIRGAFSVQKDISK
jgi:hypothetical protein